MYRVAICDDDIRTCDLFRKNLMEFSQCNNVEVEIDLFYTTENLYQYLINNIRYDIIFLDIEFKNTNGIKVGRQIREKIKDHLVDIVFISHSTAYIEDIFEVKPTNFIRKPLQKERLFFIFDQLFEAYEQREKTFYEYKFGNDYRRVDINEILYLWVENRIMHIKTTKMEDFYYGTLKNAYEWLGKYNFVTVNQSFLVNYAYISSFTRDLLMLRNDETISLSKRGYRDLCRICNSVSL